MCASNSNRIVLKVFFFLAVINLVILSTNGADVTADLGPVELSSSIGELEPLYYPLQPDDLTATKNAKEHIEWLRPKFPTGFGYMPPLDPYVKKSLDPIEFKKGIISGYIVLTNLRIDGLQKFVLNTAEVRMSIDTLNGNFSIPQLDGNVDFEAEVVIGMLPLTILGHLETALKGVTVTGILGCTENTIDGMEVFQVDADNVKLMADNVQVTLRNLPIQTSAAVIKKWWDNMKNDIANLVNAAILEQINDVMKYYRAQEIRDFLLTPIIHSLEEK